MPKISIIVPVYNVEKYLDKCVSSILNQTFKDFELILVDDGSPDHCGSMCDDYAKKDSRVRVIHKENGGLSSARNAGIDAAKAPYIGLIDSDDYIEKDMYALLYRLIRKNEADIAMCRHLDCYGNTIPKDTMPRKVAVVDSETAVRIVMKAEITSVTAVNKLYKKELFESVKYPVGKLSEDAFVIIDLLKQCKRVAISTEPKYYYIHREGSITTSAFKERDLNVIEAYTKNLELIREYYPALESVGIMRYCWAHFYVLDKMMMTENFDAFDLEKQVIKELRRHFIVILKDPCFNKSRKIAMVLLMLNKNLYKMTVKVNAARNKKLYE